MNNIFKVEMYSIALNVHFRTKEKKIKKIMTSSNYYLMITESNFVIWKNSHQIILQLHQKVCCCSNVSTPPICTRAFCGGGPTVQARPTSSTRTLHGPCEDDNGTYWGLSLSQTRSVGNTCLLGQCFAPVNSGGSNLYKH